MTTLDRLRFACELATADVDGLSKPMRQALKQRLRLFFEASSSTNASVVGMPIEWETGRDVEYPADWRNMQKFASALLLAATNAKAPLCSVELRYTQRVTARPEKGHRCLVLVSSTIASVFGRVLTDALVAEGTASLRSCDRCPAVFVRGRSDQKYCTAPQCKARRDAAYWKKYIQGPKGRKARKRQLDKQRTPAVRA